MEEVNSTIKASKPKENSKAKKSFWRRKSVLLFAGGLLAAFIITTAVRFALITDTTVHHHANFALYINGTKDEFKSFTFYEEVAACDDHSANNPKTRTHMHSNQSHLVHVHDGRVTWGHFFANLGYTLSNNLIENDNGVYITGDDGNKLTFTLNGKTVTDIANVVINSEDALLVNYGKDDQSTLQKRYDDIPKDAGQANTTQDPAACSGGHQFTFWSRLTQALGLPADKH